MFFSVKYFEVLLRITGTVYCGITSRNKQGLTRHRNSCKAKNKASNNKGKTAKKFNFLT